MTIERKTSRDPDIVDEFRFLRSWFSNPLVTGAVSPSGKALARTMARLVEPGTTGPVIELGPGTGAVTRALIERGVAPDRLFVVEYSKDFCKLLRRRFPGVNVVQGDAYSVRKTLEGLFDEPAIAVVSSLPLLTKPIEQRAALLAECFALMRPHAPFIQFTYAVQPPIPRDAMEARVKSTRRIWWNLPPAKVFAYRQPFAAAA